MIGRDQECRHATLRQRALRQCMAGRRGAATHFQIHHQIVAQKKNDAVYSSSARPMAYGRLRLMQEVKKSRFQM